MLRKYVEDTLVALYPFLSVDDKISFTIYLNPNDGCGYYIGKEGSKIEFTICFSPDHIRDRLTHQHSTHKISNEQQCPPDNLSGGQIKEIINER